jgi:hypothetical protein
MSKFMVRAQPATAGPASSRPSRSVGDVGQRFGGERSRPKAIQAKGSASPIRAWRAAENGAPRQEAQGAASATAPAPRHPFGGEGGSGPRRSATERAARMRAIEQAWKDERARQAELEDD